MLDNCQDSYCTQVGMATHLRAVKFHKEMEVGRPCCEVGVDGVGRSNLRANIHFEGGELGLI